MSVPLGHTARNPVEAAAASGSKPIFVDLSRTTLHSLCQNFIVNRLERYPPEAFLCLTDVNDFESLIRLKHEKTKPKEGTGGLDGTGRVAPTVKHDYIEELELTCPHLANSNVVDQLVWKDCVEFRFKRGGMTRPRALLLPWPQLVEKIQVAGRMLEHTESIESLAVLRYTPYLQESPMNVSLLQATGIGKAVKHFLKRYDGVSETHEHQALTRLLHEWKQLAARNGVSVTATSGYPTAAANGSENPFDNDAEDLILAESCKTWRQLFAVLKRREDERRSNLGKEMRQRRKHLASDRPKIVKVRPTIAKREQILARASTAPSAVQGPQKSKISQLRKESFQVASHTRPTGAQLKQAPGVKTSSGSFGAAVAFAASYKKNSSGKNRSKGNHVHLAGGKSMNIPSQVAKTNSMSQKWKVTR